jgi:hypothetical protein
MPVFPGPVYNLPIAAAAAEAAAAASGFGGEAVEAVEALGTAGYGPALAGFGLANESASETESLDALVHDAGKFLGRDGFGLTRLAVEGALVGRLGRC